MRKYLITGLNCRAGYATGDKVSSVQCVHMVGEKVSVRIAFSYVSILNSIEVFQTKIVNLLFEHTVYSSSDRNMKFDWLYSSSDCVNCFLL